MQLSITTAFLQGRRIAVTLAKAFTMLLQPSYYYYAIQLYLIAAPCVGESWVRGDINMLRVLSLLDNYRSTVRVRSEAEGV